ncbi:LodA/GoxA family CTQ-dependent oxidase [Thermomonospora cellulosilytica]|uniref:Uncharacterized protein n=1 Tax=Thermomonospora cellulosilytica TaxID=1411118 RepID=A0A7W3R785_9ACTN|nr:LodA/GoxA family CTQ-dependent oxidase [Thermomonospora cellulosilytica]MBA9002356.1 hypothetical protein [Thermomonospora cellulosilytica]
MADIGVGDVTSVRVHPAIGVARVGNSGEHFVGPEIPGRPPEPPGASLEEKFKDAEGRVKRQAARFRCFGFDDRGRWIELTGRPEVSVEWTVTLANKKAAAPRFAGEGRRNEGQDAGDLTIAPGPRRVSGPGKSAAFDDGRIAFVKDGRRHEFTGVHLGEIRTDEAGRLLVLGGRGVAGCHPAAVNDPMDAFNNDHWYDDVSDGPVEATVTITLPGSEPRTLRAERAWVIVAPPKFAPELDSPTTLWDQLRYALGLAQVPDRPSYTHDIRPILQRARTVGAVHRRASDAHEWADPIDDPVARQNIFAKLGDPEVTGGGGGGAQMPRLRGLTASHPSLTPVQYAIMRRWRDGDYERDWQGPPDPGSAITPDGLDRAALEACVGAALFPGIEAGRFLLEKDDRGTPKHWKQPLDRLRLADTVAAGDVTARMAIPWHADFTACAGSWWPVPRPNQVVPRGQAHHLEWDRALGGVQGMIERWHMLGFVVRDADGRHVEVARSLSLPAKQELVHHAFAVTEAVSGPGTLWSNPGELAADVADANLVSYGQATLGAAGEVQSWPLWLTEADNALRVEIRCVDPDGLDVSLETPLGPRLRPDQIGVITTRDGQRLVARIGLPIDVREGRYAQAGLWRLHVRGVEGRLPVTYQMAATVESLIVFPALAMAPHDGEVTATVDFTGSPIGNAEAGLLPMTETEQQDELALTPERAVAVTHLAGRTTVAKQTQYLRFQVTGTSPLGHPFTRERLVQVSELR